MSFELLVGPPGSGKTRLLLERARELVRDGRRVWWAGLPDQRAVFYRRAAAEGALLGLEFQTLQQVYYRLLAHAQMLKPLVVGTGRLALVGEALAREREALPSPGEARLFAGAIAEAKRFGLGVADVPDGDGEIDRFRRIYTEYERLKADAWDYDDFRREALSLAENGQPVVEADALFVDGLREVGPLDLRLLRALAGSCEVRLALPQKPPGTDADVVLEPGVRAGAELYEAPNPVTESRWVLRALKRDLAGGYDPLDLAVVLPQGESAAFASLADEYGVPVMDERAVSLADTVPGRILLELLELPEYPTASRLLPVRELAPLATAVLDAGVAGHEAIAALAGNLGLLDTWRDWLARLEVPEDRDSWASVLVDQALTIAGDAADRGRISPETFRRIALARAKEAGRVAAGAGIRSWWSALLQESSIRLPGPGGVALLDERLASGRRYRRAYLLRAVEGAYGVGEREDYFVPEESRIPLAEVFGSDGGRLPRRFEGRDRQLFAELRALADEMVITYPRADQGGQLIPEPSLTMAAQAKSLPVIPPGSRLEIADSERYRPKPWGSNIDTAEFGKLSLGLTVEPSLEDLRRFHECGMQFWLESQLPPPGGHRSPSFASTGEVADDWRELVEGLRKEPELDEERLASLASDHPWAAGWLAEHRRHLLGLRFGVILPESGAGPRASIDAARRGGDEATLYLFVAPGRVDDEKGAEELLGERWNELWAAGHLLQRYKGRITRVRLKVWPVLGAPVEAYQGGIRGLWKRVRDRLDGAKAASERLRAAEVEANPGFRCRSCRVRDVCREAA